MRRPQKVRLTKTQRQHKIAQLLDKQQVGSQAELVEILAREGIEATQVTVSRDLEELGALKARLAPGQPPVYVLAERPPERPAPELHLRRVMAEWVADVASSANLVVVRTPPGCAHVVASALDRSGISDILGTVAGDDTVLVVAAQGVRGETLARKLAEMAGART